MSEKMSVDEVAWRIASTRWITTGQIADDIAAAIRRAVADRDAEWRAAVLALPPDEDGIRTYCGETGDSCGPLRALMALTPTRETPTPESKP